MLAKQLDVCETRVNPSPACVQPPYITHAILTLALIDKPAATFHSSIFPVPPPPSRGCKSVVEAHPPYVGMRACLSED